MVLDFNGELNGAKMRSQNFSHITGAREFANSRIPVMSAVIALIKAEINKV